MIETIRARTVIIGSGCAGLNAADWLWKLGQRDVLLLTMGMRMGTSHNTGSDKQTYYKLSLAGADGDSPELLARTLLSEGVHGDIALTEAACSAQCFFRLAELGVPFPQNEYGEYVGYRTDHDTRMRASSAGPLTSQFMAQALERSVRAKGVPILEDCLAFHILRHEGRVAGVVCMDMPTGKLRIILCAHIILATGGPAQVYYDSVYPRSQLGMTGMALVAGAQASNLHQWQYGLASTGFRWNVSGSYQQVLPRYFSLDSKGEAHAFLDASLSGEALLSRCFLKGYQWPFDVQKVHGSSVIDLLVHYESIHNGRPVYLDFTQNPVALKTDFSNIGEEAFSYLKHSEALQQTPAERLAQMNGPAISIYREQGIDLFREPLPIAVCAQHCNGGISVDVNWSSTLPGLYVVGEAAGTFGAYRPGGSALNATQVGSMRAAQHIAYASKYQTPPLESVDLLLQACPPMHMDVDAAQCVDLQKAMSASAAHIRDIAETKRISRCVNDLLRGQRPMRMDEPVCIEHLTGYDQLVTQAAVLETIRYAAEAVGSTGAGLVLAEDGAPILPSLPYKVRSHLTGMECKVIQTHCLPDTIRTYTIPARPIPERDNWFEKVWHAYRARTQPAHTE